MALGITAQTITRRVASARDAMRKRQLDALVVYAAPPALWAGTFTSGNVRYLTDWAPPANLRPSLLVLPLDGDPVLYTHTPIFPRHHSDLWVKDIRATPDSGTDAAQILSAAKYKNIGLVGGAELPAAMYLKLTSGLGRQQLVNADDLIARLRIIKDPEEIALHRASAKIADAMLYAGMNGARAPEVSAHTLMLDMEDVGRRLGASVARCWMDTGPAPEYIYLEPQYLRRPVVDGDQLHTGMYVVYEGYWAHELRMGVRGRITPDLQRHFEMSLEVQEAGLAALKPGRPVREVVVAMEKLIEKYSPYTKTTDPYRFRQGHGLGLEYSDPMLTDALQSGPAQSGIYDSGAPGTSKEDELLVQPGMLMELHPNFNTAKFGSSTIGDMVLVTEKGTEFLTGFPRALYQI